MDNLQQVASLIDNQAKKTTTVAVVSAFSGVTDRLLAIAAEVIEKPIKDKGRFVKLTQEVVQDSIKKVYPSLSNYQQSRVPEWKDFIGLAIKKIAEEIMELQESRDAGKLKNKEFSILIQDRICGIGEFLSSFVLARFLTMRGLVSGQHVDLSTIIARDDRKKEEYLESKELLYGNLIHDIRKKLRGAFLEKQLPVVGGYIGYIPGGILQTIDRGYTDSTAALTAAAARSLESGFKGVRLQIWKEVPGLMSSDPRLVEPGYNARDHVRASNFKVAKLRSRVSFVEAAELSVLGGMKAINPNGIHVLDGQGILLEVRNTFEPDHPGTLISDVDDAEVSGVRFISGKKKQIIYRVRSNKMVNQSGVAGAIFNLCSELKVAVDAITTSGTTVAFSVDGKASHLDQLLKGLQKIGTVRVYPDRALVCCIGNSMANSVGLLGRLAGILSKNGINIEFDGGDAENNITFIVEEKDCDNAIKALHNELFS